MGCIIFSRIKYTCVLNSQRSPKFRTMGLTFSFSSTSETITESSSPISDSPISSDIPVSSGDTQVNAPVESPWTLEETYNFLYGAVLLESQGDPYTNEFTIEVPRPIPDELITGVQERIQKNGWRMVVKSSTQVVVALPLSQSTFGLPPPPNVDKLFDIIQREISAQTKKDPYTNQCQVTIPVSFTQTSNDQENARRAAVRQSLTDRILKRRWIVSFTDDHPFQSVATIKIPRQSLQ